MIHHGNCIHGSLRPAPPPDIGHRRPPIAGAGEMQQARAAVGGTCSFRPQQNVILKRRFRANLRREGSSLDRNTRAGGCRFEESESFGGEDVPESFFLRLAATNGTKLLCHLSP